MVFLVDMYDSASRYLTLDGGYSKESTIPTTPWTRVIGNILEVKVDITLMIRSKVVLSLKIKIGIK